MRTTKVLLIILIFIFSGTVITADNIEFEQSFFIIESSTEHIKYWKDNKAYDVNDRMIINSWGYDEEAEKDLHAVKFDNEGNIIKRSTVANDIDSSKGVGSIELKLNVESDYTTPLLIILEGDNGAGIEFKFSNDNNWKQLKKDVPAGNYRIYQIAESSIKHYPVDKEFIYLDTYNIEKDKTSEFEISSVEYYEESGLERPSENQIDINKNADVSENHQEEVKEELESTKISNVTIFIIFISFIALIGFTLFYIYRRTNK